MPDEGNDSDEDESPNFEELGSREQIKRGRGPRRSRSNPIGAQPVFLLVGLLLLLGCDGDSLFEGSDPSRGVLERAEFSWEKSGFGCFSGCNAKAPLATGAIATLHVENAASLPAFAVRSDDPLVARVSGTSRIEVEGLQAGRFRIVLEELNGGALVDEFPVTVADVRRIGGGQALLLAVNGSTEIEPSMFDDANRKLVGRGGLSYAPSPSLDQGQLGLSTSCDSSLFTKREECVTLFARNVGEGLLEIEAQSGATLGIPLDLVIADEVVTKIRFSVDRFSNRIIVTPIASASGKRVFGARCTWSLTPSSSALYIDAVEGGSAVIRPSRTTTPRTGTLLCRIGPISRSIALRL